MQESVMAVLLSMCPTICVLTFTADSAKDMLKVLCRRICLRINCIAHLRYLKYDMNINLTGHLMHCKQCVVSKMLLPKGNGNCYGCYLSSFWVYMYNCTL